MSDGSDLGSDYTAPAPTGSQSTFAASDPGVGNDGSASAAPPKDTSSGGDAGWSIAKSNSPMSSVRDSDTNGDARAGLNIDVTGNDGLKFGLDGGHGLVANVSAEQDQGGLPIDIEGKISSGTLIGFEGLGDIGNLVSRTGTLIDVGFDQGDGQTAAILDVVVNSDADAHAIVLGSDTVADGSADILSSCGLLDGVLDVAFS